ncbi:MAG TPA: hypothetical protein VGV89_04975 [Thermoplasmata archaeon]|nr:hypothetical protein [Thermoplasmata archaeon]
MAGTPTRPVRIARRRDPGPVARPSVARDPTEGDAEARDLPPTGNRAGMRRARRLLAFYLASLFVVYAGILALVVSSPYAAIRTDVPVYAALTVIAAISAIAGYLLTIGRAPWSVYADDGTLVIRERFGAVRRYSIDPSLRVRIIGRTERSWLSPEPIETVRVSARHDKLREYVVGEGGFSGLPELADRLET